jgi:hypothetical protein
VPAQRRPRLAVTPRGILLEVHPDYVELVSDAADRELDGVPVDLVVTADLPAGSAARLTRGVALADEELERRRDP